MTRLRTDDIRMVAQGLNACDEHLRAITGFGLRALACRAVGLEDKKAENRIRDCRVFAVPMTCGQGAIETFSETIGAIASHLGFDAYVSDGTDMAGMADAFEGRADILLSADDDRFVAIHVPTRRVVDNAQCTGMGFCAGLAQMAGGLKEKPVLVIGCGPVGRSAAIHAAGLGAMVTLFDIEKERCRALAAGQKNRANFFVSDDLASAIGCHDLIIEATPAADVIGVEAIRPAMLIAAPGVPCGVTLKGRQMLAGRLLWDSLAIGVATMLMEAIACKTTTQ